MDTTLAKGQTAIDGRYTDNPLLRRQQTCYEEGPGRSAEGALITIYMLLATSPARGRLYVRL